MSTQTAYHPMAKPTARPTSVPIVRKTMSTEMVVATADSVIAHTGPDRGASRQRKGATRSVGVPPRRYMAEAHPASGAIAQKTAIHVADMRGTLWSLVGR